MDWMLLLGKFDGKLVKKIYDDALSPAMKELGKTGEDVAKTARLIITAPFQLGAAFQDRFERFIERVRERVPEERQIPVPPEIAGPALQYMMFLPEESPLWQIFEELLTAAIDSEKSKAIHPSFTHLVSQLSRDEAIILHQLKSRSFVIFDTLDLNHAQNRFENRRITSSDIPSELLWQPDQFDLYYNHLESMSLVDWPVETEEAIFGQKFIHGPKVQTGLKRKSRMSLTEFGRLFASACIPEDGFR